MILYRYLFKNLIISALSISAVLLGALWLTQSIRFIEIIINHTETNTLKVLFKFAVLLLPDLFVIILPFSFFLAVLFIYNRFLWDRELTVMRALGINNTRLALPAIAIGIAVTGFILFLNIFILPLSMTHLKNLEFNLKNSASISIVKEGEFNSFPGLTLYVREKGVGGKVKGIFAYIQSEENAPYTLVAENGSLKKEPGKGVLLSLFDGIRQTLNSKTEQISMLYFEQTLVTLDSEKKNHNPRQRKPSEFSLTELFNPDITLFKKVDCLRLKAEGHNRILSPFLAIAFVLIAVSLLLLSPFRRTGFVKRILFACGAVLILEIICLVLINLSGKLPSLIWGAYTVIFTVIGLSIGLLLNSDRLSKQKSSVNS